MKKLLPVVLALAFLGMTQSVSALTVSGVSGATNGFSANIVAQDSDLISPSAASPQNDITSPLLSLVNPDGHYPLGGFGEYDTIVRGAKNFRVFVPEISADTVIISVTMEIVTAALGRFSGAIANPDSRLSLNGHAVGALADSETGGEPDSSNVSNTFTTAIKQRFDISSIFPSIFGGFNIPLIAQVVPAGTTPQANLDGYAVDYISIIFDVAGADEPLPDSSAVPLPAAFWLLVTGLLSITGFRKRK